MHKYQIYWQLLEALYKVRLPTNGCIVCIQLVLKHEEWL